MTVEVARMMRLLDEQGIRPCAPFASPDLIEEALTHSSFAAERAARHNERLEMLGDAVLGFLVADLLFKLFPDAPEGALTRLRASLVHEESLASRARTLNLGDCLRLGRGEAMSGGRARDSLLADAFEALVAALYLSEGLDFVRSLVEHLFRDEAVSRGANGSQSDDYKTALQERCQGRWRRQPHYRIVAAEGPDHERVFVAEVLLETHVMGQGEGRSKKAAEQRAAHSALANWQQLVASVEGSYHQSDSTTES